MDASSSAASLAGGADLDPMACAAFLLAALTLAGVAQTAWFRSPRSRVLMVPLDAGAMLWGQRLLGANKTVRGFVVMVPAAAAAFAALSALLGPDDLARAGLWRVSIAGYALLGGAAGFGFMAGELPNSFVKRRLGIPVGGTVERWPGAAAQFVVDRLDSGLGTLAAMSILVPVPLATWVVALTMGPCIHWVFSVVMFRLGIKARPA
jgi:CDP-2,3-bis-(O-geranylgeranyl)-sn-glycerol synthase